MLVTHMSFLLQCRRNALSAAPFCCPGTSDATAERQSPAALRTASAVVSRPEFHTFRCGGMPSRTIPRPTLNGTAASETSHNEPPRSHAAARGENGTALAPQRQCQSVPFTAGSLTLILPSLSRKIIAASSWRFVSPATRSRSSNDFERLVVGGRCPKRFGLVRSACRAHGGTARHGPSGHLGLEALAIRQHWHPIALAGEYTGARAAPDSCQAGTNTRTVFRASSK